MIRNKKILSVTLGIGIIILLLYFSDMKEVISVLGKIHPIWVVLAVLAYNINWVLRGYRWQIILDFMGQKIGLKESISLTILGNFINLVTPAKIGDFARAFVLKRNKDIDISKGLPSVIIDRILDLFGVGILAYISLIIVSKDLPLPGWIETFINNLTYILIIGSITGFIVIGVISRFKYIFKYRFMHRFIYRFMHRFIYALFDNIKVIYRPIDIIVLGSLSIIIWIFEISTTVILFYSLNLDMNIPLIMSAIMIANLTKVLPLTPGGIGAYEGTVAAILTIGGLPYTLSLTIGILDHGIKNIYTLLFGSFSLSHNGIDISNVIEHKAAEVETKTTKLGI